MSDLQLQVLVSQNADRIVHTTLFHRLVDLPLANCAGKAHLEMRVRGKPINLSQKPLHFWERSLISLLMIRIVLDPSFGSLPRLLNFYSTTLVQNGILV